MMPALSKATNVAAYRSVATHSAVVEADPCQLISLLMDGALDRLNLARTCILRGEKVNKAATLHRVGEILGELRGSLNHNAGGGIARDLDVLYEYMMRRVMMANMKDDVAAIDEVKRLLSDIRSAWAQVPSRLGTRETGK